MSKFIKYPEIGGTYQHYKGGKYMIISLAHHTETDEVLIIYQSIGFGSIYARPLNMWFELVGVSDGMVPRFEEIKQKEND